MTIIHHRIVCAARFSMLLFLLLPGCGRVVERSATIDRPAARTPVHQDSATSDKQQVATDEFAEVRRKMVEQQMAARNIVNERVLDVMRRVPRHHFVPEELARLAYRDSPLPIGNDQTISQPYMVALMTQLVDPQAHHKALDIGTGSGYQAAVLAELVDHVYSIEIVESLANDARERLATLEYENVTVRHGDGYAGWPTEAAFDVIIVAAAPDHIPEPLIEQLAAGGKLVIPVGTENQVLILVEKNQDGVVTRREVEPVIFVPMTGQARKTDK